MPTLISQKVHWGIRLYLTVGIRWNKFLSIGKANHLGGYIGRFDAIQLQFWNFNLEYNVDLLGRGIVRNKNNEIGGKYGVSVEG